MPCVCADPGVNQFIAAVFNQCQGGAIQITSFIFGWLSIFCWIVALYPQIRLNFLLKKTDAISLIFILQWIGGDLCNAISTVILKLLFTQQFLGIFYCVVDVFIVFQLIYYRLPYTKNLLPLPIKVSFIESQFYVSIILIIVVGMVAYGVPGGQLLKEVPQLFKQCPADTEVTGAAYYIGLVLSYLTIPLYGLSKPGQIWKNWKRKSTDGLSGGMFICTFSGNVFQFISLMCDIANGASPISQAPFIFSATWPAVCDILILLQVWYYGKKAKQEKAITIVMEAGQGNFKDSVEQTE